MIFPIGDDNVQGGTRPFFTYLFIAVNVLVFLYQFSLGGGAEGNDFIREYGSIPDELMRGEDWFTVMTSMFMHGGWMHLIGNMLFLWVFADNIEAVIGRFKFVLFYIGGGIAAAAIHTFFNQGSTIPAVGASGAISAVLGAYLVMFPGSKIKIFVAYFFRSFHMSALIFLGLWIGQQLLQGFMSLGPETAHTGGVAWWAHIGGFMFGVLFGFLFRKRASRFVIGNPNYVEEYAEVPGRRNSGDDINIPPLGRRR